MKDLRSLVVPALCAPLLLALGSIAEAPSFAPEVGTSLTKTVTTKIDVTLDEMSMVVSGQELPGGMEMSTSNSQTVEVTDTYVAVSGGMPQKLERTFDALSSNTVVTSSHPMMGDNNSEMGGSSELEGMTVVFTWDEDAEEYEVAFEEGTEGDEELLTDLQADLDMRGMLPPGDVEEGATWSIDPMEMRSVLAPGGVLKIVPDEAEGMGMNPNAMPSMSDALGALEGDLTGTLTGYREVDGVRCAVIGLEIDLSSANDLSEFMSELMSEMELPGDMEIDITVNTFDMEFVFEGTGELLWNMETGLIYALDVNCDLEQIVDMSMNMNMAGQSQDMEQSMTMSGSMNVQITTEG